MVSGSLYTLSATTQGATRTANYTELTKPYLFDGSLHEFDYDGSYWTYDLSSASQMKFRLQKTNTTASLETTVYNEALCPEGADSNGNWTWAPGNEVSMYTYGDFKNGLIVAAGSYTIRIKGDLSKVQLVSNVTKTLTSLTLYKSDGSVVATLTDLTTTAALTTLSTGREKYKLIAVWNDGATSTTEYYYPATDIAASGTKTLTSSTTDPGYKFFTADGTYTATIKAALSGTTLSLVIQSYQALTYTYTSSTTVKDVDGSYVIYATNQVGNRKYLTPDNSPNAAPARQNRVPAVKTLTAGGTYALSTAASESAAAFAIKDGLTLGAITVASDGESGTLKVIDPSAGVNAVYLMWTSGSGQPIHNDETTAKFVRSGDNWVWTGTVETNASSAWNARLWIKTVDTGGTIKYYTTSTNQQQLSPNTEYDLSRYSTNYGADLNFDNTKYFYMAQGTGITITVTMSDSWDLAKISYTAPDPNDYYLAGKFTGCDGKWDTSSPFKFTKVRNGFYRLTGFKGFNGSKSNNSDGEWNNWASPRFCIYASDDAKQYITGNWILASDSNTYVQTLTENTTSTAIGFNFEGNTDSWTITYEPETKTLTFIKEEASFPVKPQIVRDADGDWSALTSDKRVVYIRANYLNGDRIVPDWEMLPDDAGVYTINNATLRDKGEIKAEVYRHTPQVENPAKQGTMTLEATYTLASVATGETRSAQFGREYDLKLDLSAGTPALTATPSTTDIEGNTISDKLPPFISMVGFNMQQKSSSDTDRTLQEETPDNGYTADGLVNNTCLGWQESWILYDENGNIMRDNSKRAIFSSQWPPKKPIYFTAYKIEGSSVTDKIELTSDNLIFRPDRAHGFLTKSQWKSTLTDPGYTNLWKKKTSSTAAVETDTDIASSTIKFARYVINNMWVLGASKIWTGWPTSSVNNDGVRADWSQHVNWGYGNNTANDGGTEIQPNYMCDMEESKGNFMFANPTFFKTVEFYLPVDEDGLPDLTNINKARFYTTPAIGNAQIRAKAISKNFGEAPLGNNSGAYCAKFDPSITYNDKTLELKSWTITRYDAVGSDMTSSDPEDWNKAGTKDDENSWTVATGTAAGSPLGTYDSTDNDPDWITFIDETAELENGKYFYGLHLEFTYTDGAETKTVTTDVISNPFSIVNLNYTPNCVPLQLIKIKDIPAANAYSKYNGKMLTYRPTRSGDYYIINVDRDANDYAQPSTATTERLSENVSHDFVQYLRENPDYFVFTSDYYVFAFNGDNYASDMTEAVQAGTIEEDYSQRPDVYIDEVTYDGSSYTTFTASESTRAKRNATTRMYGRYFRGEGSLQTRAYQAQLGYTYTTTGSGAAVVQKTPATNKSNQYLVPTVPMTYGLTYTYSNGDGPTASISSDATLQTVSAIDGEPVELTFPKELFKSRTLDCTFSFKQPNVSWEVLNHYDVNYKILLTNTATLAQEESLGHEMTEAELAADPKYFKALGYYTDPSKPTSAAQTLDTYTFKVTNVQPDDTNDPVIIIQEVKYRHNTQTSRSLVATYDHLNQPMTLEGASKFKQGEPLSFTNFKVHRYDRGDGLVDYLYHGHNGYSNDGDHVGKPGHEANIKPQFFHIEMNLPAGSGGGYSWNRYYYNYPKVLKHDPTNYACGYDDPYYSSKPLDPNIGQPFGVAFPDPTDGAVGTASKDQINLYVTPIYVFERNVALPMSAEAEGLDKIDGASYVKRRSGATDVDPADIELVVMRGAGATLSTYDGTLGGTTGLEDVSVEAVDAEPEYYTIQGVRVVNPQPGQVYIVRRGAIVTKEYLR